MGFIDHMRVHVQAGRGGNGVVRWLHMKGKDKGGPAGGNGGKGGNVFVEGVRDLNILASYRFAKKFRGKDGEPGGSSNMFGADGEALTIRVPVGSIIKNVTTKEEIEILEDGQKVMIAKGGSGGLGNAHFKGSVNQNPIQSTPGKPGEHGDIEITVKLIADAGLIGLPNAGKSSLLNALTKARSRVGAYPFTTLDPHLGDLYGYILADIPGLIEGASLGKGLGSKFLRHIERTGILVHLVSVEQEDVVQTYRIIRKELEAFGTDLGSKKELVLLTKTDLVSPEEVETKKKEFADAGIAVFETVSVSDSESLKKVSDLLIKELKNR